MMEEFVEEILKILKSNKSNKQKKEELQNYHENDIADVIPHLSDEEKTELFKILDEDDLSEVISYADDVDDIIEGLDDEFVADILEEMDSDDAVDILEDMDNKDRESVLSKMDEDAREDAEMILSYNEDQIGRIMTTNFIVINKEDTIPVAMKKLVKQSGDNDNISTIFVVDDDNKYIGAVDLKDLIKARKNAILANICMENYPSVLASAIVSEVYQDVVDYGEDIIPVLDDSEHLIGALTAHDLVEVTGEEMQEDYQKFAAINGNVDLDSNVWTSIKKRIPWLILLLFLGFIVSMLISSFSNVIATLTTMVFFQSVVLDMAGNAGTQSLAVTIRILSDQDVDKKMIRKLVFKEFRVGLCNGFILSIISFISTFVYLTIFRLPITNNGSFDYIHSLFASGIIGAALFVSMTLSSLVGCTIPIIFHSFKIDPAAASGPLITTLNDLVAVAVYYGLSFLFFIELGPLIGIII